MFDSVIILDICNFTYSVLFGKNVLLDEALTEYNPKRVLQLPLHVSKLTTNGNDANTD